MQNGSKDSSGLGVLFDSHTDHLKASHGTFFRHWERLIDLEATETEVEILSDFKCIIYNIQFPCLFMPMLSPLIYDVHFFSL